MGLAVGLSIFDALLQNVFCLFYKLPVQINGVPINTAHSVVLPEDVVGCLFVILVHHCTMSFPFLGKLVCGSTIASFVGIVSLPGMSVASMLSQTFGYKLCQGKKTACPAPAAQGFAIDHIRPRRLGFGCG